MARRGFVWENLTVLLCRLLGFNEIETRSSVGISCKGRYFLFFLHPPTTMARQTDSKLRVNVEEQLERLVKQLEDLENYKQVPFIFKNWQSNMFYSSFIFFVEKKGRDKLE